MNATVALILAVIVLWLIARVFYWLGRRDEARDMLVEAQKLAAGIADTETPPDE